MNGQPDVTTGAWGKFEGPERGGPRWHPLIDHCIDVAACCEALLRLPLIAQRLGRIGDIDNFDEILICRLSTIALLHDMGKANWGFQRKILPKSTTWDAGHIGELGHLFDQTRPLLNTFLAAVPLEEMADWTGDEEEFLHLLYASVSHHGAPWSPQQVKGSSKWWESRDGYDPIKTLRHMGNAARTMFPAAFVNDTEPFNACPAFQHAYAGLVMLADWLGSDMRMFPFSNDLNEAERINFARTQAGQMLKDIGLDVSSKRIAVSKIIQSFKDTFAFQPNEMQKAVGSLKPTQLAILESETGSGKTEAALWQFKRLFEAGLVDGLYFALPTRVAATQIQKRVSDAVAAIFPANDRPEVLLAVPGYAQVDDIKARILPGFEVQWPDGPGARFAHKRWAAERPKRFLAAQIAVGTIDQALLSNLKVKHAHLRSTALMRHLLVVDEVHASDAYMTALLKSVLDVHLAAGGYAFLMSATLGSPVRDAYLNKRPIHSKPINEAIQTPYPCVSWIDENGVQLQEIPENGYDKKVKHTLCRCIDDLNAIADAALRAARGGAKVLVIRNTVSTAIATQIAVEARCKAPGDTALLFHCGNVPTLHHGRFARKDRSLIDKAVEARVGKKRSAGGAIVVGTQTLEQSLDIDADLLITDLCPMDVLLQRIGRLHRHPNSSRPEGFEVARCRVLTPADRDVSPQKGAERRHGLGRYIYEDIRVIEATWRLLEQHDVLSIPAMNRGLVERATHPKALEELADELGEAWREDGIRIIGLMSAQHSVANLHKIWRDRPFGEDLFPDTDETIRTRLGEDDRSVEWPDGTEPPIGPFGQPVKRLILPAHLCKGIGVDAAIQLGECRADGFRFTFGTQSFDYGRFGLRKLEREA